MGSKKGEARRPGRDVHAPRFVRAAIRKLRARKKDWATEKDREYHDALFGSQEFDPFSFAYPGYITIRRFADLASPFVKNLRSVLVMAPGKAGKYVLAVELIQEGISWASDAGVPWLATPFRIRKS